MSIHFLRGSTAAALCLFTAPAALADISAQELWTDWQQYLGSVGYDVSASEQMSGDTLTLTDFTMSMQIPNEDAAVTIVVPSLSLVGNGDGTVNIEIPNPLPVKISGNGPDGAGSGDLIVTHTGTVFKVSGSPSDITYDHSSTNTTLTLANMMDGDKPVTPEQARFVVSMDNTAGKTQMVLDGMLRTITQSATVGAVNYDIAVDDSENGNMGSFKGALQGVSLDATVAIPKELDPSDMAAMVKAGFATDGTFAYTGGNSAINGSGDGSTFAATTSSQGGSLSFGMNAERIRYGITGKGTAIEASGSDIPFPVTLNLAETLFNIDMPVAKSDTPQDFALALTLGELTMSDAIWGIFDPAGNLPRDPATLALDLSGQGKLLYDILDPAQAEAMANSPTPPAELNSLNIANLLVQAVGAKLTGVGAFTFDNTDMQTIPGMPRPEGAIDLALNGANALIDNLIAMGILSDQDAMPARMMMGMFAVPGDGPDSLKSRIEINAQGHILANGQRIK